jgi:hypothetical protein
MADFKQALDWLNEGKKVKPVLWKYNYLYLHITDLGIDQEAKILDKDNCLTQLNEIIFYEWELYEEKPRHFCTEGSLNLRFCQWDDKDKVLKIYNQGLVMNAIFCPFCGKKAAE